MSDEPASAIRRGAIIRVPAGAIGNRRGFRMRVEEIQKTEARKRGVYVLVYGVEVTTAGETRQYFGNRYSEFKVWLGPDDYERVEI